MKNLLFILVLMIPALGTAQSMRMFMVAGQSNCRGHGDSTLSPIPLPGTAFEYLALNDSIIPLLDPVGEYHMTFNGAFTGSAWPAFAKEFNSLTGDSILIIPAAKGGSPLVLNGWGSTGYLHENSSIKADLAIAKTGLNLDGVIWLQGESDATDLNQGFISQADYEQELQWVIQIYRDSFSCDLPFYIIQTGLNNSQPPAGFMAIREAQKNVADADWRTHIVYDSTDKFLAKGWMSDGVHYDQTGYNDIGVDVANRIVEIESNSLIHLDTAGFAEICPEDNFILNVPFPFSSYLWSTGDTTASLAPTASGQVWCDVSNGCGVYRTDTLNLVILPTIPQPVLTLSGDTTICKGDTLTLMGPGGFASYLWNNGDTVSQTQTGETETLWLTVSDTNGCQSPNSDTIQTQKVPNPQKPVITYSSLNYCNGDSIVLEGPAGYFKYHWSDGNPGYSDTVWTQGMYYLQVENVWACISPMSDTLSINPLQTPPSPILSFQNDTTLCFGESLILIANSVFTDFQWSSGDTTASINVIPPAQLSVRISDQNGCKSNWSDTLLVSSYSQISNPVISIIGNSQFCDGDSAILHGPPGYSNYLWNDGYTLLSRPEITSGSFSLVVTDSNQCISASSLPVSITAFPLPQTPQITPTGPHQICDGSSISLYAPPGYTSYNWFPAGSQDSLQVDTMGVYALIVTDQNGCSSPISSGIGVNLLPRPPKPIIATIGNPHLCQGQKVTLTTSGGFLAYNWSDGNIWQRDTVNATGNYSVTVTGSNGCESVTSDTVTVTVNPLPPQPTVTALGPTDVCQGDTVWLQASPGGFPVYNWIGGHFGEVVAITQSGSYSVFIQDTNFCNSFPASGLQVTVSPQPQTPGIIYLGQNQLKSTVSGDSYTWLEQNIPLPGQNAQILNISVTGVYRVIVFNGGCPSDTSQPFSLVNSDELLPNNSFLLYPNPNHGSFRLKLKSTQDKDWRVEIIDVLGKTMWQTQDDYWPGELKIEADLPKGIYFLKIRLGDSVLQRKMIVK